LENQHPHTIGQPENTIQGLTERLQPLRVGSNNPFRQINPNVPGGNPFLPAGGIYQGLPAAQLPQSQRSQTPMPHGNSETLSVAQLERLRRVSQTPMPSRSSNTPYGFQYGQPAQLLHSNAQQYGQNLARPQTAVPGSSRPSATSSRS
jgi:hypothetical protein